MECILQWGGVVDELDFASRLLVWNKSGFVELGDSTGFDTGKLINQVRPNFDWNCFCCTDIK